MYVLHLVPAKCLEGKSFQATDMSRRTEQVSLVDGQHVPALSRSAEKGDLQCGHENAVALRVEYLHTLRCGVAATGALNVVRTTSFARLTVNGEWRLKLGGSVLRFGEAGSCPHAFTTQSNPLALLEQVHPMSTTAWAFVIADPPSYQASGSR